MGSEVFVQIYVGQSSLIFPFFGIRNWTFSFRTILSILNALETEEG